MRSAKINLFRRGELDGRVGRKPIDDGFEEAHNGAHQSSILADNRMFDREPLHLFVDARCDLAKLGTHHFRRRRIRVRETPNPRRLFVVFLHGDLPFTDCVRRRHLHAMVRVRRTQL